MSTNFPTSLDALTNPSSTDPVSSPSHSGQHSDENDAIEALEAKVGVNSSAVTTSHDYKLGEVTGSDKAVGKTASQTLTNKTLTTPTIGSFANAAHNHEDAAGGGQIDSDALSAAISIAKGGTGQTSQTAGFDALAPTTTQGDLIYHNGTDNVRLAKGTALQQLRMNAGATAPEWGAASSSPTCVSVIPGSVRAFGGSVASVATPVNTTAWFAAVYLPFAITVNKISFYVVAVGTSGTVKVGVYSEDGQTKEIDVTTASISGAGVVTTAVSAVALTAGIHYVALVAVSTTAITVSTFTSGSTVFVELNGLSSEPILTGRTTVTAGTLPTTFTTSSLTEADDECLIIRLDN